MNINIRFGLTPMNREYATAPTVGQVITDPTVKAVLGHGDNVRVMLNGVEVGHSFLLSDGASLTLETKCNEKGAQ